MHNFVVEYFVPYNSCHQVSSISSMFLFAFQICSYTGETGVIKAKKATITLISQPGQKMLLFLKELNSLHNIFFKASEEFNS